MAHSQNNWLERHKSHCQNYSLDNDFILNNISKLDKLSQAIEDRPMTMTLDMNQEILLSVVEDLKNKISDKENVGLMCSGGEDSIYLLIILVEYLQVKPKLFCYRTNNNKYDVNRLKLIAKKYKLNLYLFNAINLNSKLAYDRFVETQDREPNDLAQPVHNALYIEAVEKHKCKIVVDGQFCDTVLLSNPQNHFLFWHENYPKIFKIIIKIAGLIPLIFKGKIATRINYLKKLCYSKNQLDILFELTNINNPDNIIREHAEKLKKKFGIQLTFAIYFYFLLLRKRERDKYLICPLIISPFDNFDFAIKSNANIDQILSLFLRKRPIRALCKKHFPGLFKFQNTLPFELE
jgi:hypothetical protein